MPFVSRPVKSLVNDAINPPEQVVRPDINPPARRRLENVVDNTDRHDASSKPSRKPAKESRPKKQANGDHAIGYCRPPKEHQFDGSKPGPGRPKGSQSQDTLLRAELEAKQTVRIEGRERKVSKRKLVAALYVNTALSTKDHKHLAAVNSESRRLFPEVPAETAPTDSYDPAIERQVLAQMMELFSLGEPNPDAGDPLADLASGRPDLGRVEGSEAWAEGDWSPDAVSLSDGE